MKKRELYQGKKPYAYIAFSPSDAQIAEPLVEILEGEGYRFWFNSKIVPSPDDITEISKKLGSSCMTVLVLTKNSMHDPIVTAVLESTVERRTPLILYVTYEDAEITTYIHALFDRAVNAITYRTWEQSFLSSNSVRQALEQTKGLTHAQEEELYTIGMEILGNEMSTKEELSMAMKSISYAATSEFPPALKVLGDIALGRARGSGEPYSTAVLYYKVAAEKGNIDSIYRLGCLIADGEGFAQNTSLALPYLAIAAVNNIADAQFRIAEMMEYGNGVAQNRKEATKWYIKALENGDRRSYIKLAERYLVGDTVDKDEQIAAEYYTEAANDGSPEANLMLAKMYHDGKGVRADEKKSQEYFFRAAEKGVSEAQYNYGMCLFNEEKYVEAFKWLMVSVSDLPDGASPEPDALYAIASCFEHGYGTAQDRSKAFMYYYSAAKKGHANARISVAECYKHGLGVPVNKRAASFFDPKGVSDAE